MDIARLPHIHALPLVLLALHLSWAPLALGQASPALSAPWQFRNMGTDATASASPGTKKKSFRVKSTKGQLWGKSDTLPYVYLLPEVDLELTIKIGEISAKSGEGTAGILVRSMGAAGVPSADDPHTYLGRRNKDGMLQILRRSYRGGDTVHQDLGPRSGDLWLRLIRSGDVISLWHSADGKSWSAPRYSAIGMGTRPALGLVAIGTKGGGIVADFEDLTLRPPAQRFQTGWLGNSLPGGGSSVGHVMNFARALWTDPASGEMLLVGEDENSSFSAWTAEGKFQWFRERPNFQHGSAVAADAEWVYQGLHQARGQKDGFVRLERATGRHQGGPYLQGSLILGMDTHGGELILADATANMIRYWATASMTEIRSIPFERPGPLAVNPATGDLWVIRRADSGPGGSVIRLDKRGQPAGEVTSVEWPRGIAATKDTLFIADSGKSQQVHLFDAQGKPTGRFGAEGGIWSSHAGTQPGQTHPEKLNFPHALAVDQAGNLTVVNSGPRQYWGILGTGSGTEVRKFDAQRKPLWSLESTIYVDVCDFMPGTDGTVLYSKDSAYRVDYAQGGALDWQRTAFTIDPFRFPEDPRLKTARTGGTWLRQIHGKTFLIVADMVGETLSFFRFEEGTKTLVPAFRFNRGADNRPGDYYLWRDANGDGQLQESEKEAGEYRRHLWGMWVDSAGALWTATHDGPITRWPASRLDEHGNPVYEPAQAQTWPRPQSFFGDGEGVALERLYYLPETDTLYLSGYTQKSPKAKDAREWGTLGRELACFTNWSKQPQLSWRIPLPYEPNRGGHHTPAIKSAAFAGEYVFLIRSSDARIYIHRQKDGQLVDTLHPGPEVGGHCGLIDIMHGLNAVRRDNGEYVLAVEDDDNAKNLLIRWKP